MKKVLLGLALMIPLAGFAAEDPRGRLPHPCR